MNSIMALAIALIAGLVFSRLAKLVKLPNVTGYLIAGLLLGPYCLKVFNAQRLEAVTQVSTVALCFIAFSIGDEFSLANLKRVGVRALVITAFEALTAVILVDTVLLVCGFDPALCLTLGAIAAATAPAATLMVTRQYKAHGPMTNTLLSVVAMDDAVGLMVFSISISIAKALTVGEKPTISNMLLQPLAQIVCSLLIGFAIGLVCAFVIRFFHSRNNKLIIMIAGVMLGGAIASWLALSNLLLCMAVGAALVNFRRDSPALMELTDRWTPPLFMLFFILSGARLDIKVLLSVGILGIIYIVTRAVGKYIGASIGGALTKSEPSVRKYLGLALIPQAGVAIGMGQMVLGILPEYGAQINAVVLCATLVYELLGPLITKIALKKAGEIPEQVKTEKA